MDKNQNENPQSQLQDLGQNRFIIRDPDQNDQTKSVPYVALNPKPPVGWSQRGKFGGAQSSTTDGGAPNILTGTVIVSCFIQTSALPSRVEIQGNDITFFDDTMSQDGKIIGDTSRLIFTHNSGKSGEVITQGFILEKRASIRASYDNVLSWYATPARQGYHNNMFIGRNGSLDEQRNLHSLYLGVRKDTSANSSYPSNLNGVFAVEYSETEILAHPTQRTFIGGSSDGVLGTVGQTGYSSAMTAGDGGALYWLYKDPGNPDQWIVLIAADNNQVVITVPVSFGPSGTGPIITSGAGDPDTVVTAPPGSIYMNSLGGTGTAVYAKETGTGNTGWSPLGGSVAAPHGMQVFTSGGTFNVPAGVSKVWVRLLGGGQGGGYANSSASAGSSGASADYVEDVVSVTPGGTVTVTIGSGGAGASSPGDGTAGGDSSFGSLVVAKGGASSTTSVGSIIITSQNGVPALFFASGANVEVRSAQGGSNPLGLGGVGARGTIGSQANGNNGQGKGTGGSGGANGTAGGPSTGGNGVPGTAILVW